MKTQQLSPFMNITEVGTHPSAHFSAGLRVIETDPYTDSRWAAFVLSHPEGSVYHHPAWLKALSMEYRQKGLYLACESAQGELVALMPMMYTRGLPLTIGGSSTGRRLSSLPRTPLAGPLSTDQQATIAIIQTALQYANRASGAHLQIKTSDSKLKGLVDRCHLLALEELILTNPAVDF